MLASFLSISLTSEASGLRFRFDGVVHVSVDDLLDGDSFVTEAGGLHWSPVLIAFRSRAAMRELGVAPAESIFVGDSPWHDIAGAHGAGMRAVLTRQYVARPYGDIDPQPDAVIDHMRRISN